MSWSSKLWVVFGLFVAAIAGGWVIHQFENTSSATADEPSGSPSAVTTDDPACPSDGDMQKAFGFDKLSTAVKPVATGAGIAWEGCKWNVQWVGPGTLSLHMLKGWQFTVTETNDTVSVWYGDDQTRSVKGATFRHLASYNAPDNKWVQDECELLRRELNFGQTRNPSYTTVSGNVCKNGPSAPATKSSTAVPPTSGGAACYATAQQVADAVGGNAAKWSQPDSSQPKNWKYIDKGTNVQLKHPGAPVATIDYWNGGVQTATQAGQLPVAVDEATVKCS